MRADPVVSLHVRTVGGRFVELVLLLRRRGTVYNVLQRAGTRGQAGEGIQRHIIICTGVLLD